jgi:predicted enzyme related to lactoylglutathione lyase
MLVHWIEIPTTDFARAATFYQTVFGASEPIEDVGMEGINFGFLPGGGGPGSACLAKGPGYEPSEGGTIVFLDGGDDLAAMLGRVESAGGAVLLPKKSIGDHGFIAHFRDSEGNRIGLHSPH